jgi:hypothetical protein
MIDFRSSRFSFFFIKSSFHLRVSHDDGGVVFNSFHREYHHESFPIILYSTWNKKEILAKFFTLLLLMIVPGSTSKLFMIDGIIWISSSALWLHLLRVKFFFISITITAESFRRAYASRISYRKSVTLFTLREISSLHLFHFEK